MRVSAPGSSPVIIQLPRYLIFRDNGIIQANRELIVGQYWLQAPKVSEQLSCPQCTMNFLHITASLAVAD